MNRTKSLAGFATLLCLCTAANAQSTLRVLDYGTEPRSTIRYQFQPGQVDRVTMEMVMDMSMEVNGQKMPAVGIPPIRTTMELRVVEVAADGSARLEFKTQSAEAPVEQVAGAGGQAALGRALAGMTLLSGTYRTDTRGKLLESQISLPDGYLPANTLQTINQMMGQGNENLQQFPEEVLGVGARWQLVQRREVAGKTLTMVQEFTLKSRSGNQLELLVKGTAPVVAEGSTPAAAAPADFVPAATGTLRVDLRKLVPTGTIESASNSSTTMQSQNGPSTMKMSSKMRMSMMPAVD